MAGSSGWRSPARWRASPRSCCSTSPAAGCNPVETAELEAIIRGIVRDGVTVVLVEHDMRLVMNVSDRIHVLANGRTLAEGRRRGARQPGGDRGLSGVRAAHETTHAVG